MLSARDITGKKFAKSAFGGYRVEEVDSFLSNLAEEYARVVRERDEALSQLKTLTAENEGLRKQENSLSSVLIGAQSLADNIIHEAKGKSELIIRDASLKSERIVKASEREVDRSKQEANRINEEVAKFKTTLLTLYKSHLEVVTTLPSGDKSMGFLNASDMNAKAMLSPDEEKKSEPSNVEQAENNAPERAQNVGTSPNLQANSAPPAPVQQTKQAEAQEATPKEVPQENLVRGFVPNLGEKRRETNANALTSSRSIEIPQDMKAEQVAAAYTQSELYDVSENGETDAEFASSQESFYDYGQEEFDDIDEKLMDQATAEDAAPQRQQSRFGELRFGQDYELHRDDQRPKKKRKR